MIDPTKFVSKNILEVVVPDYLKRRLATGIPFVDKMLGGGFVPSITNMLSGDPGSGKTTLMVQVADGLTANGEIVLFNSVEQTADQIAELTSRVELTKGFIFSQHKDYKDLMLHAALLKRQNPDKDIVIILDSISSMANGSRAKAQEIGDAFIDFCQATKAIGIFLVHTTKGGVFAGNNAMKHNMDAHFHLKVADAENDNGERLLVTEKNRFAKKTSEEMVLTDRGHVPVFDLTDEMELMPILLDDDDDDLILLED